MGKELNLIKFFITVFLLLSVFCTLMAFGPESFFEKDLSNVLEKTAEYCRHLKHAAFHFVCDEEIIETIAKARQTFEKSHRSPWHKKRSKINSEYQIIKDGDLIEEYRINRVGESRIAVYSYKNALVPLFLFSKENQEKYLYKTLKIERVLKRKAFKIMILSKTDTASEAIAYAWIDCSDFSIIKTEFFPKAFKGYKYLQNIEDRNLEKLVIRDIHYFGFQRQGLRFPSKTEILITYSEKYSTSITPSRTHMGRGSIPTVQMDLLTKIKTIYKYSNYKFFTAKSSDPFFKPNENYGETPK